MPMHDWTRVSANYYHDFHGRWLYAIADALNAGILPSRYFAAADQKTPPVAPDVLTLELTPGPNGNGVADWAGHHDGGIATLTKTKPRVRHELSWEPIAAEWKTRRLVVRHNSDHRIVAVIELVSPANKSSTRELRDFVGKACGLLSAGIHVLLVDPFPPSKRDPRGVPDAVWKWLVGKRGPDLSADAGTLSSYVAANPIKAFVESVTVGERLKRMPMFLTDTRYVNVPLEEAYAKAWASYPAAMKTAVLRPPA